MAPFAVAHLVDVLVDRRAWIDLLLDAVEPRPQHHRQREIGIARRIRHPQLDARPAAARRGDADERTAVLLAPRNRRRRLVTGHETLVEFTSGFVIAQKPFAWR